ncbi:MAG: hypothetical protein HFE39_10435 [Clostridiales bacterium]|nr:hypothetical protein [Clostridiales bacterium]
MKFGKRFMALALAASMLASVGAAQVLAADAGAVAPYAAVAAAPQTNLAIANSVGLGANSNNLMGWKVGYADVYVNTYSGNFTYTNVLNERQASDYPELEFRLTYNSQDPQDFGFGPGFRCNFNMQVVPMGKSYAFVDQTGTRIVFDEKNYAMVGGVEYRLSHYDDEFIVWSNNIEYFFDADGRFTKVLGGGLAYSYTIEAEYDENGLLKSVTPKYHNQGNRRIEFARTTTPAGVPAISGIYFYATTDTNIPSSMAYLDYSEDGLKQLYMGSEHRPTVEFAYDRGVLSTITEMNMNNTVSVGSIDGPLGVAVSHINLEGVGEYQYLYGKDQTMVIDPSGLIYHYVFDENGMQINP